jgi:hypothetical protein
MHKHICYRNEKKRSGGEGGCLCSVNHAFFLHTKGGFFNNSVGFLHMYNPSVSVKETQVPSL